MALTVSCILTLQSISPSDAKPKRVLDCRVPYAILGTSRCSVSVAGNSVGENMSPASLRRAGSLSYPVTWVFGCVRVCENVGWHVNCVWIISVNCK